MKNLNKQNSQQLTSTLRGMKVPLVNSQMTIYNAQNQNQQQQVKQPQIEVTQMKFTQNSFPFVPSINGEQVNNQQIVQGVPVQNTLFDLERNNTNQNQYGDDLRLQKYELEKIINDSLVSFIKHNKISMVFMIILVISYIIQIVTQSNSDSKNKNNSKNDSTSSSPSNNVYYFILDYLFWFGACVAAIKSQQNFNLKYINVYLGFMVFSFIPQILGYADIGYRNNQNGQTAVLVINIIACILEFFYKLFFGIIKAIGIRALYAKHTSQFQGMQALLYNGKPSISQPS